MLCDDLLRAGRAFQRAKFGVTDATEQCRHAVAVPIARRDDATICFTMSPNKSSNDIPRRESWSHSIRTTAIDLAIDPDVLLAEPLSKVAATAPSPAADENPTSAD
jgi:hypothetical protein